LGLNWGKRDFQDPGVVLHNFYVQLLLIKFISNLNWKVRPKVKLAAPIYLN